MVPDGPSGLRPAGLLGFVRSGTNNSAVFLRMDREKIQRATSVWTKVPCWCQGSEVREIRLVGDHGEAAVPGQ